MPVTSRRLLGYAFGIAAIGFAAATCSDLTGPTGLAPQDGGMVNISIMVPPPGPVLQMKVGDRLVPSVVVSINNRPVSRAQYVFATKDTSLKESADTIVATSAHGDTLIATGRGPAKIIVSLVGATIGGKADPQARTADTVDVLVSPFANTVTSSSTTLTSLNASLALIAKSVDALGKATKAGTVVWSSSDPTIATVPAAGTYQPSDSTIIAAVTAKANGSVVITATFDNINSVPTTITVRQVTAKFALSSRFGGTNPIALNSINETITVTATPVDALDNPLGPNSAPQPAFTFVSSSPTQADIHPSTGVLTAKANGSAIVRVASTGLTNDSIRVTVDQKAKSILIGGVRTDTLAALLLKTDKSATSLDSLGSQTGNDRQQWTSSDLNVMSVPDPQVGTGLQAVGVGTAKIKVTRDGVADSITIVVTNNPASVEMLPDTVRLKSLNDTAAFASLKAKNANNATLTTIKVLVRSLDPSVVDTLPGDTLLIAKNVGVTFVVGTTANGKADTSRVEVTNAPAFVDITPTSTTLNSVGDVFSGYPVDFRNGRGVALPRTSVTWSTADATIANVSGDGLGTITAVGPGGTFIKAVSPGDPLKRDSIFVTVTNAATSIVATPSPAPTLTSFGSTVTFSATVKNAAGNPIPSGALRWSVPVGAGFVTVDPITGVATAVANGTATIRATFPQSAPLLDVTQDVSLTVAQAVAPTHSTITPAPSSMVANGASTSTITVQLKDANDNNIAATGGSTVLLATSLGGLGAVTATGPGQYQTTLTAGTQTGAATITGTVGGLAITNNAIVQLTAGAASKYLVTSNNSTPVAGSSVTIRAQLADVNNNSLATAGNVVQFTSTNGGSFTPVNGQATTDAAGVATISFTTNASASSHTITGATGGLTGASTPIVSIPGSSNNYLVTVSTTSPAAGAVVTVSAQLRDASGNAIAQPGISVAWMKSDANGSFPGGATDNSLTNSSGVATINLTTHTVSGTATTVTATGGVAGTSPTITTVAGAASKLTITQAPFATPQSGIAFPTQPTIQLRDAQTPGNAVSAVNVSVTATITSGGGTLSGTTTVQTDASGLATFTDLAISGTNGARTLTFSSSGLTSIAAGVTLGPGSASQIAVNAGNGQSATAGSAVATPPSVIVRDAGGNPVALVGVTFTVTGGGGTANPASGSTVTTDGLGIATLVTWTLGNSAGANTLTAASAGLAGSPVTFTATGQVGAASQIALNAGNSQTATAGSAVPIAPSVLVRDALNNPVAGVSVTFAVTGGGGTISSPTGPVAVTNSSGIAALSTWTLGSAAGSNNNTLTATAGGLTGSPVGFTASATAGAPQNIISNSVTSQSKTAGTAVTTPPSVIVRDANNNPVSGVPVTFTVTAGGGSTSPASGSIVATIADGSATLTSWTLGVTAGTNTVEATVAALTLTGEPVTFNATGTVGTVTAAQSSVVRTGSNNITANGAATSTIAVTLRDANSNPVAGKVVSLDDGAASSTITAPSGTTSDASGIVVFTVTNTTAETATYTATANDPGAISITQTAAVTFVAGTVSAAQSTVAQSGSPVTANGSSSATITVTLRDANNNPVAGKTVTLDDAGSPSVISAASGPSTVGGVVTFTVTNATAQTVTYTATANDPAAIPITQTAQVVFQSGGANNQIALTTQSQSATVSTLVGSAPSVRVRDAQNNPVSLVTVTFTIGLTGGGGAQINGGTAAVPVSTDGLGVASLTSWRLGTAAGTDNNTVVVTAAGVAGSLTFNASGAASAATQIAVNAGNGLSATAGSPTGTPPSVIVTDASANPIANVPVTFTITGGGGTTSPSSGSTVLTNALGIAALTTWTLGTTAGSNTLEATVASMTLTGEPVVFTATGTAGTATTAQSIVSASPTSIAADGSSTSLITIQLKDANGNNTTTGLPVTLGTSGGTLLAALVNGGGGTYTQTLRSSTTTGPVTLTGQINAVSIATTATVNFTATTATKYIITTPVTPSNATAGTTVAVTAQLSDVNNNPVLTAGKTVTWSSGGAGGSFTTTTSLTDANGQATVVFTVSTVATTVHTVTATDNNALTGSSGNIAVVAAAANRLGFTVQPSNTTAGVSIAPPVKVAVQDQFGNTVLTDVTTSVTVAIDAGTDPSTGTATLSGTKTLTVAAGVATFSNLSIDSARTGYKLTATSIPSFTSALSSSFNIAAAAANKLTFTVQPSNTAAGASITPAVKVAVQDAIGNTVTSDGTTSVTVAIDAGTDPSTGTATLSGIKTLTVVAGVATFSNLSIDSARTGYKLAATAGGLTTATSSSFNITVGAAAKLGFRVQPSNTPAGATITLAVEVEVQDAGGNRITGATNSITVAFGTDPSSGTAFLSGTKTRAAVAGVATFNDLSVDSARTGYRLSATAGGLTTGTSSLFNITPGTATKLTFTVQPSNTAAGSVITPSVRVAVQDALGNTVTGDGTTSVTVAFGTDASGGSATLGGTKTRTVVAGVAVFDNLTVDSARTGYTLSGTAGGLTTATSAPFNITPGTATKLTFTVQPSNTAAAASITPAVKVAVQDAVGNTVTSDGTTSVTVAIDPGTDPSTGSATLSGTKTLTVVAGVATFSNLSIDSARTGYKLRATATGLTTATSTTFNITVGSATKLAFRSQPTNSTAGATITPAVTVEIEDAGGNRVTTATPNVTVAFGTDPSTGTATLGGTLTQAAVAGLATFNNLTVNKAFNGYTLAASSGGLTGATSTTFNITATTATKYVVTPASSSVAAGNIVLVTAQLADVNNNPVATSGKTVVWTSNTNGGAFAGGSQFPTPSSVTDANGQAVIAFTVSTSTADNHRVKATDNTALTGTSGLITVVPDVVSATQSTVVRASPGAEVLADNTETETITVTLKDQYSNVVPGKTVSLDDAGASSTITPASTTSDGSGVATFTVKNTVAEAVTYTATANDPGAITITQTASVTFVASRLTFTDPGGAWTAGVGRSVTITARDASGNPALNYDGLKSVTISGATAAADGTPPTFTLAVGSANFGSAGDINFVDGVATTTITLFDADEANPTLSASATTGRTINTSGGGTITVTVDPGTTSATESTVLRTAPGTQILADNTEFETITVTLKDTWENVVPGKTVSLVGAPATTTTITDVGGTTSSAAGVVVFRVKNTVAEDVTYTATANDPGPITITSATPTVTFVASRLVIVNPGGNWTAGSGRLVTIEARDASGNPAANYDGLKSVTISGATASASGQPATFTLAVGSANFGSAGDINFVDGVATTTITLYDADEANPTLSASATTGRTITTAGGGTITVVVDPAVTDNGQSTVVRTAPGTEILANDTETETITVTLRDVYQNLVSGKDVVLSDGAATTTITPANVASNASGQAAFTVKSNVADDVTYTATAEDPAATFVTITQTVLVNFVAIRLTFTDPGGNWIAGTGRAVTITARDGSGAAAANYDGLKSVTISGAAIAPDGINSPTFTLAVGSATFGNAGNINFVDGVATTTITLYNSDEADPTLSAEATTGRTINTAGPPSGTITVTVDDAGLDNFLLSLTSPQTSGVAFIGANTLRARDVYHNTVTGFDASVDNVTFTNDGAGTVTGLSGGDVLNDGADFVNGVANLTTLGFTYTGTPPQVVQFTATGAGKTGQATITIQ